MTVCFNQLRRSRILKGGGGRLPVKSDLRVFEFSLKLPTRNNLIRFIKLKKNPINMNCIHKKERSQLLLRTPEDFFV